MRRQYLSEAHRQYTEACIQEIKKQQPMSWEAMKAQCDRIKKASEVQKGTRDKHLLPFPGVNKGRYYIKNH